MQIVSSNLVEAEANLFGLINAFTNDAQKFGPLQRIEMERFAGTLLEALCNSSLFFPANSGKHNACLFSFCSR